MVSQSARRRRTGGGDPLPPCLTLTPGGEDQVREALAFRLDLLHELTNGWTAADCRRFG